VCDDLRKQHVLEAMKYKYSFFPRTLLDWNTLPAEIRLKYSLSVSESADLVD